MIDPVLSIAAAMSVQSPFTGKAHIDQDAIVSENRDLGLLGVVVLIFKLFGNNPLQLCKFSYNGRTRIGSAAAVIVF